MNIIERASRPLLGFGVFIDNTIKGLICLYEIMSKNLIQNMILNEVTPIHKQMFTSHWHLFICVTSKVESKVFMVDTMTLIYILKLV